jgi:N6-L-threonylcarbamoyladenine synthase
VTDLVLGIETSCDDTSVALVDKDGTVVAASTASQVALHNRYGGVYPEMASRAHVDKILPTVRMVLDDSGVDPRTLRAIGVTRGPGLIGSLMVGVSTAAALGQGWGCRCSASTTCAAPAQRRPEERRVDYPATILLVSGGHTFLARMTDPGTITLARLPPWTTRWGRRTTRSRGCSDSATRRPGGRQARRDRQVRCSRSRGRCSPTG